MKKLLVGALTCALLAPLAYIGSKPATAQSETPQRKQNARLLEQAAKRRGTAVEDIEVINSTVIELPLTKRRITTGKVLFAKADEVFTASVDENGEDVELRELQQEEERAHKAKYGRFDPVLYERVRRAAPDEQIKVAFWVKLNEAPDAQEVRSENKEFTREDADQILAKRRETLGRRSAAATTSLRVALRNAGVQVEGKDSLSPVVYATLPARLLDQFAQREDMQRIYLAENKNEDYMNIAAPSMRADDVWNWYGTTGTGSRVAIIEDSRVDFDNSCLALNLGTRVPGDSNVDQHATTTAGMAASTNAVHRGIADGAGIYSANGTSYSDANMSAAIDAAASNTHISNNSWGPQCGSADGTMNIHARHADYVVRYLWDTVVAAAGNNGTCSGSEYVGGVASGYNVIAVGNYDDRGTTSALDNVMNASSSYLDPLSPHSDREKPEVAAPGTAITSLLMAAPGTCPTGAVGSGTSYSSPMVAGAAALLMSVKPALRVFPEAVKALILAGAMHNVEGSARLSEFDGAGGLDALQAYENAINNRYQWLYVTPSSFDASGYITINLGEVQAGRRVKVALSWDSNPASDYTTNPLQADLDLNVEGPGVTQWSSSWDNSYEVVDFTAPSSGTYTIKIRKYRFDGAVEYVGVAWTS